MTDRPLSDDLSPMFIYPCMVGRWHIVRHAAGASEPDSTGWGVCSDGEGYRPADPAPFTTEGQAVAEARRRHREDIRAERRETLSAEGYARADRLDDLVGGEGGWSGPKSPGRYAVEEWYDDGGEWTSLDSLAEVRGRLRDGDIGRVVDLDTGAEVPYTRTVSVEIGS